MIEISFNSRIYKRNGLKTAMKAFSDFGGFTLKKQDKYYNISINGLEDPESAERLRDEFCNYALYQMKTDMMK